jgi:hypothetical protein
VLPTDRLINCKTTCEHLSRRSRTRNHVPWRESAFLYRFQLLCDFGTAWLDYVMPFTWLPRPVVRVISACLGRSLVARRTMRATSTSWLSSTRGERY